MTVFLDLSSDDKSFRQALASFDGHYDSLTLDSIQFRRFRDRDYASSVPSARPNSQLYDAPVFVRGDSPFEITHFASLFVTYLLRFDLQPSRSLSGRYS
jgi:hypothetical protein